MTNPLDSITAVQYKWKDDDDLYGIAVQPIPALTAEDIKRLTDSTITFNTGALLTQPMLTISEDGFYVRGVKVEQDEKEAATVYKAFKRWMVEAELRRDW